MRLGALVVAASLVVAACSSDPADGPPPRQRASEAAPLPEARTEVAGTTLDGDILAIGGLLANGSASSRVDRYDTATDEWSDAPPLPLPLHHVAATETRGRAWVIGGFTSDPDGGWQESARVWSLGPTDAAWREEPSLPVARGAPAAGATADGTIVVVGGTAEGNVLATTSVLRPRAASWEAGAPMDEPREHVAATTIDDRVYAVAGRVGSLDSNRRTVESWDPSGREASWRREPSLVEARGGTSAAGRCVAGGEEPAATIASVECLDEDGDRWSVVGRLSTPRHGLAVAFVDGALHAIGGGPEPGLTVSTAHEVLRTLGA